jgi:hypothetical protein
MNDWVATLGVCLMLAGFAPIALALFREGRRPAYDQSRLYVLALCVMAAGLSIMALSEL